MKVIEIKEDLSFQLIPLYKTEAILKNWRFLSEGLEKVLFYCSDDTNISKIMNELLSGEMLMWLGFVNGEYSGFLTTKLVPTPMGNLNLWIMQCYAKPHTPSEVWEVGLEIIEDYAKTYHCKQIKFYSVRDKGWERKLYSAGFKRGYVEFIKEVM